MPRPSIPPEELRHHTLFAGLNDAQLPRVIQSARVVELDEGEHLFERGQDAHEFFLLRQGRIKLFLTSPEGIEKVIHLVTPGETFGEAIMFMDSQTYPVTAAALRRCEVVKFRSSTFRAVLQESTEACFRLLADMSTRLKEQLQEVDALTLQNATLRFVSFLLRKTPDDAGGAVTIDLGVPKNVLASRLSVQPESLSRILRQLQKADLIRVEGSSVEVIDLEALRSHCS